MYDFFVCTDNGNEYNVTESFSIKSAYSVTLFAAALEGHVTRCWQCVQSSTFLFAQPPSVQRDTYSQIIPTIRSQSGTDGNACAALFAGHPFLISG